MVGVIKQVVVRYFCSVYIMCILKYIVSCSYRVLCETVRDMIGKIGSTSSDTEIDEKCANLSQKLNSLLQTLQEETEGVESEPSSPPANEEIEVGSLTFGFIYTHLSTLGNVG